MTPDAPCATADQQAFGGLGWQVQGVESRPARPVLLRLRAGLVALNLLVAALVCLLLWRFWAAEVHDAEKQATATATLLQQSVTATFDKVAAAKVGPNGSAGLRTDRLEHLARASDLPTAAASSPEQSVSDTLRQRIAASPDAGKYRAVVASDQIERIVAYQKLPGYPGYALVGLAMDDVLRSWTRTAAWATGFTLRFIAATVAIARVAKTSLARQDEAQALYDAAPCGDHTLDAQRRYLSINAIELGCARAAGHAGQ